eukprot:gene4116-4806_t
MDPVVNRDAQIPIVAMLNITDFIIPMSFNFGLMGTTPRYRPCYCRLAQPINEQHSHSRINAKLHLQFGSIVGAALVTFTATLVVKKLGYRTKLISLKLKSLGGKTTSFYPEALQQAQGMSNSTHNAYLLAIDSYAESVFINKIIGEELQGEQVWLGAKRSSDDLWLWTWGNGVVFYDTRQDHCLSYCGTFNGEDVPIKNLLYDSSGWHGAAPASKHFYIIELESVTNPVVTKVNDYDGIITINNYRYIETLQITAQHFEMGSTDHQESIGPVPTIGPDVMPTNRPDSLRSALRADLPPIVLEPNPAISCIPIAALSSSVVTVCRLSSIPFSTAGVFNLTLSPTPQKNRTIQFTFASPHIMAIKDLSASMVQLMGTNLDVMYKPAPNTANLTATIQVSSLTLSGCTVDGTRHMNPTIMKCTISGDPDITLRSSIITTYNQAPTIQVRVPLQAGDGMYYSYSRFLLRYTDALAYSQASRLGTEMGYVAFIPSGLVSFIKTKVSLDISKSIWTGAQTNSGSIKYHNISVSTSDLYNIGWIEGAGIYTQNITNTLTMTAINDPNSVCSWVIVYGALDPIVDTSRVIIRSFDSTKRFVIPMAFNYGLLDSTFTIMDTSASCTNSDIKLDWANRAFNISCLTGTFEASKKPFTLTIKPTTDTTQPYVRTLQYIPKFLAPIITGFSNPLNSEHLTYIYGTNFVENDDPISVQMNGGPKIDRGSVNSTSVAFYPTFGLMGTYEITVTTDFGTSNSLPNTYAPMIKLITPLSDRMTISGNAFGNDSNKVTVNNFGPSPLTPATTSYEAIILMYSNIGTLRSGMITVTAAGQTSEPYPCYIPATFTSITSPPVSGGIVTLYGSFLSAFSYTGVPLADFKIDDKPVTQLTDIPGGVTCRMPPGSGKIHTVTVSGVITATGPLSLNMAYQPPRITGVSSTNFGKEGLVTVFGSNFDETGLGITIGGLDCTNPIFIDSTKVSCTFASNVTSATNQSLEVAISVDGQKDSSYAFIYYREITIPCPNGCSLPERGSCVNGQCQCHPDWNGALDCSVKLVTPDTNNNKETTVHVLPPVIKETAPLTTIGTNNDKGDDSVHFDIAVTHIRETSPKADQPVVSLELASIVWHTTSHNDTSSTNTNTTIMSYVGSFPSYPGPIVSVNVTVFLNDSSYNFAGDSFQVFNNSVKYQIEVSNWTFIEAINSLEVIFLTQTDNLEASECQRKVSVTSDESESLRSFQLTKGNTILRGRFSDRLIVDGRVAMSKVKTLDTNDAIFQKYNQTSATSTTILTRIISPRFLSNLVIDPSFASLIVTEDKDKIDSCSSSSSTKGWVLPVIIVGSVIGASIIVLAIVLTIKKLGYRTKLITLKLKTMGRSKSRNNM